LKEKALTDLILNSNQSGSELFKHDENLMSQTSFGGCGGSDKRTNSRIDQSSKGLDFDHFFGQIESHKDELIERERILALFLNKNGGND
jgi:hypothetical protein